MGMPGEGPLVTGRMSGLYAGGQGRRNWRLRPGDYFSPGQNIGGGMRARVGSE